MRIVATATVRYIADVEVANTESLEAVKQALQDLPVGACLTSSIETRPQTVVYTDGAGWNEQCSKVCHVFSTGYTVDEPFIVRMDSKLTNNQTEYLAVQGALEQLHMKRIHHAEIRCDSELVVKQVNGEYKTEDSLLIMLRNNVRRLLDMTRSSLVWIPREENLAGIALEKDKSNNGGTP